MIAFTEYNILQWSVNPNAALLPTNMGPISCAFVVMVWRWAGTIDLATYHRENEDRRRDYCCTESSAWYQDGRGCRCCCCCC